MAIEVKDVTKRFGDFVALDDVSIKVPDGGLTALLGPSGSGKSTLLRVIAGLEQPDQGQVLIDGEDNTGTRVQDRNVGFVFQHYAAFKHMTVFDNIAFGLKIRGKGNGAIRERVKQLIDLVHLTGFDRRFPNQLSGGQRQRMALARALAVEPRVLLLDEPFGALDAKVREELRTWLRRLHDEVHVTTIFVTHDQEEAMDVAEQIIVMNDGARRAVRGAARPLREPGLGVRDGLRRARPPARRGVGATARRRGPPRAERADDRGADRPDRPSRLRGQGGAHPRRTASTSRCS